MNSKFRIKNLAAVILAAGFFLVSSSAAFAHVVVKPSTAAVGAFSTFTMGVPSEKDNPTVSLRLIIPQGLAHVTPNVKPGWNIQIIHENESMKGEVLNTGEKAHNLGVVTEIIWTGGSIPEGQRDDFLFSAQVPVKATSINWKVYQTYQDGTIISWDQIPNTNLSAEEAEKLEKTGKGPYSVTKILNDLSPATSGNRTQTENLPRTLSIIAIALSALAFGMQVRKK